MCRGIPTSAFHIYQTNTIMLSNIRISPAQAVKEQSDRKLRAIERVLAGEAFTITTDRLQRVYHFVLRDDLYYLLCGGLVLGRCDTGAFFPSGFVVMLHILGGSTNHSVLTEHIRFVSELNQKGGAVC